MARYNYLPVLHSVAEWRNARNVANVAIRTRYVAALNARRYVTAHVTAKHATGHSTGTRAHRQPIMLRLLLVQQEQKLVSLVTVKERNNLLLIYQ